MTSRWGGLSAEDVTHAEMLRMRLISASQEDGVSPTRFFELLEAFVNEEGWQALGIGFVDLVKEPVPVGMNLDEEDFRKLLKLKHRYEDSDSSVRARMEAVRRKVREELDPELDKHGNGPGRGNKRVDNIKSFTPSGTSETYAIRRLKRDRPELAEEVLGGRMSANAAAIKAGFRKRTVTFYPDDIERTARILLKHFDTEELCTTMQTMEER